MGEATREAQARVAAARAAVTAEADALAVATRSALDIKAKVRANPGRTVALAGGTAFLALRGPQRLLRGVVGRLRPTPARPRSLLPEQVERILDSYGEEGASLRAAVEHDFADYLQASRKNRKRGRRPSGGQSFWKLFDTVTNPVAARAAKDYAERLFSSKSGGSSTGD